MKLSIERWKVWSIISLFILSGLVLAGPINIDEGLAEVMDWTGLQSYPAACPAGSSLTQLGDTVTCTDLREYECIVCQDDTCAYNGSTYAIIQSCIDSIDDDGGSILIKKGEYNISYRIMGKKNLKISGEGAATELNAYSSGTDSILKFAGRHDDWLVLDTDSGNWSGASITISDEGTIKRLGAGSLKLIAGAGTTAYRDISSEDWSDYNGLNLWVYVDDSSYLFNVTVHEGANSDKFVLAGGSDGGDWSLFNLNLDNPTTHTGTVNYSAIDNITIAFTEAHTYYIDDMRLTMNNIHISDLKFSFQEEVTNGDGITFEDVAFSSINNIHFDNVAEECIALYGVYHVDIAKIYVRDTSSVAYNPVMDVGCGDGDDSVYHVNIDDMYITGSVAESGSTLKGFYVCGEHIDMSNIHFLGGKVDTIIQIRENGASDYIRTKHINIYDCVFTSHAGVYGIKIEDDVDFVHIYRNTFKNIGWQGILIEADNSNIQIDNNHFSGVTNSEINIGSGQTGLRIFNNYGYSTDTLQNSIDMEDTTTFSKGGVVEHGYSWNFTNSTGDVAGCIFLNDTGIYVSETVSEC